MPDAHERAIALLLTGLLAVAAIGLRWTLGRVRVPAVVGYLALGFVVQSLDGLPAGARTNLGFLADVGLVVLLFRVGMEADLRGLRQQLRNAASIWLGNVLVSGACGFTAARWLLDLPLVPSLFVATALTATSLAVPVAVWREAEVLDTPSGALLLDVAELDDVSAVLLMATLLALAPSLMHGDRIDWAGAVTPAAALVLAKLLLFGALCFAFARYGERPLLRLFRRIEPQPYWMLLVVGTGFVVAAVAGLLGFSLALGAFFAGLVFSRDPVVRRARGPLLLLNELFPPFFFLVIGLQIDAAAVGDALWPGAVLLLAAVAGKLAGTLLPALPRISAHAAWRLGISMVQRAEIALVVMSQGLMMGPGYVGQRTYAAMVFVVAATCFAVPPLLRPLLRGAGARGWIEAARVVSPHTPK